MLFSLISPYEGFFTALLNMLSYGISMALCTVYLSSYADVTEKDTHTLPKLPFLCVIFTLCVIYAGNVLSSAVSEVFSHLGYSISTDFPIYSDIPSIITSFVHLVILPPLLEEILMRRFVLGSVLPFGKSGAVIFSSLMFALFHMNLMQMPFAFLCGLIFGYFTVKTGSVFFAVLLHFLNNLSAFVLSYIGADVPFSSFLKAGIFIVPLGILCAVILYKNGYFREKPRFCKISPLVIFYALVCILFAFLALQPIQR